MSKLKKIHVVYPITGVLGCKCLQALRSQSSRGDCYDNAQVEGLWSRLKTEVFEGRERPVFANLADAQVSIATYFDYYNHERLHSSIAYCTAYYIRQQLLRIDALNCPA